MKNNIYATDRQKQIVEEMLIENYSKYYKLAYSLNYSRQLAFGI